MVPMQAKVLACRALHVVPPTPVFRFTKLSTVVGPLKKATTVQVSPGWTRTNLLPVAHYAGLGRQRRGDAVGRLGTFTVGFGTK